MINDLKIKIWKVSKQNFIIEALKLKEIIH